MIRLFVGAVLLAIGSPAGAQVEPTPLKQTAADFAHLKFLIGRWSGTAPDGSVFYEEYAADGGSAIVSRRYADDTFATVTDTSRVSLADGAVHSDWGKFRWRATRIAPGVAEFSPVNAPSAFTWRRVDADRIEAEQRWTDDKGVAQKYVVPMRRIAAAR